MGNIWFTPRICPPGRAPNDGRAPRAWIRPAAPRLSHIATVGRKKTGKEEADVNEKEIAAQVLEMADMTCEAPEKIWADNVDEKTKLGLSWELVKAEIEKKRAGLS